MTRMSLTGTRLLVRRALRADRWFWLVWVLVLWSFLPATASAYRAIISDDAAGREVAVGLASNPTMRAILGPPYDLLQVGGFVMWRVGGFVATCAAIMAALGVLRATRAEEEAGRTELLRSGAIGRHASLAAALLTATGACLLLGLLIAGSMTGLGTPLTGSLAMGLAIAATGMVFAGVGAVAAQLTSSARTARGLAMGAVGAAYLLRALADGSAEGSGLRRLGWLSPVEWAPYVRPYAGERWWVLIVPLVVSAGLVALAITLESRRDFGAGLRAAKPGPAGAPARLRSAGALAWRLDRGSVLWSLLGFGIFSLVIGTLSNVFDQVAEDPTLAERFRRMGGGAKLLSDAFYVAMLGILIVLIALVGLSLLDRLRREEDSGRAELVLSTATSRKALLRAYAVPALLVPVALVVVSAVLLAVPQAVRDRDPGALARLAGAGLVQAPGVLLIVALAVAVHGLAPRLRWLPWAVTAWSVVVNWIGGVLGFPQRLLDATPFGYLPRLPADTMSWTPVVVECLVAAVLLAAGWWGYARRDIT